MLGALVGAEDVELALAREAVRLHQRYIREVVEAFAVCPWAKPASGRVRAHVLVDTTCSQESLALVIDAWAADPRVEIGFVIAPRFDAGAPAFDRWCESAGRLRDDVFLSAPFHPEPSSLDDTVRFLRRTPDPTIQLVRRSRLERVREQDPPHYADIFALDLSELHGDPRRSIAELVHAHNQSLVDQERAELESIIRAIHQDRHRTYRAILG